MLSLGVESYVIRGTPWNLWHIGVAYIGFKYLLINYEINRIILIQYLYIQIVKKYSASDHKFKNLDYILKTKGWYSSFTYKHKGK